MATITEPPGTYDRITRHRPFSSWVKRFTSLKSSNTSSNTTKAATFPRYPQKIKKVSIVKNNPHSTLPRSYQDQAPNSESNIPLSIVLSQHTQNAPSKGSFALSHTSQEAHKSRAPTMATTAETIMSDTGKSGAGTSMTAPTTEGDKESTFSSRPHSVRSQTTTLTTLQSTTPATAGPTASNTYPNALFNTAQPASAVPAHLQPIPHPTTYHGATANNILTDDASIMTLASSSKRRRRNSLDTNASIRALAPASVFGGSRESLPLSMLSGFYKSDRAAGDDTTSLRGERERDADGRASMQYPRSISGMNIERASLISNSGVTAPVLTSERNSYISQTTPVKYAACDGASIRSGYLGEGRGMLSHVRQDSLGGGSITRQRKERDARDRDAASLAASTSDSYFAKEKDRERGAEKDREMVTAPTSPVPG